jgi:hypothetical protein
MTMPPEEWTREEEQCFLKELRQKKTHSTEDVVTLCKILEKRLQNAQRAFERFKKMRAIRSTG